MVDFIEGWDAVIPLKESGCVAAAFDGVGVKVPDRVEDGVVVSIEDVFPVLGVAGDVELSDAMVRDVVEIVVRVEAMILRRNVDVIYVEKDSAIGHFHDFAEEFPLGHLGLVELCVTTDILDTDGDLDKVADGADFRGGMFRDCEGVRHGEQVVGVTAIDAAPAKVIGKPWGTGALDEGAKTLEVLTVGFIGGAEVHGDPVLDDAVLLEDAVEDLEGAAGIDHKIFRDDLEPIDDGFFLEDVAIMRDAKADADAVVSVIVERVGGHGGRECK